MVTSTVHRGTTFFQFRMIGVDFVGPVVWINLIYFCHSSSQWPTLATHRHVMSSSKFHHITASAPLAQGSGTDRFQVYSPGVQNVSTGLVPGTSSTSFVRWQMSRLDSDYVPARLPDCLPSATELFRSPLLVSGRVCPNASPPFSIEARRWVKSVLLQLRQTFLWLYSGPVWKIGNSVCFASRVRSAVTPTLHLGHFNRLIVCYLLSLLSYLISCRSPINAWVGYSGRLVRLRLRHHRHYDVIMTSSLHYHSEISYYLWLFSARRTRIKK